jgi:hypothetical protein
MPTNVTIASGGGAIVVSRDLNNGLPTTTETIPFSAFTSDLIVTPRGGVALVLYRVGTTFEIARNASRSDDRGFGNDLFGSTDPTVSNIALQAAISTHGGGTGTGLTPTQTAAIAKIDTLDAWVKNENDTYAAGDNVLTGDSRVFDVTGTIVSITYRGANGVAPTLSATALDDWRYMGQSFIPAIYPGAVLCCAGFQYRRSETGELLQLKYDRVLPSQFDRTQWELISASIVRYGAVDLLQVHTYPERMGVFANANLANGPNNAAVNCSGTWSYGGDAGSGMLTLNVQSSDQNLVNGIWTLRRSTTKVNNVDVAAWGSWTKFSVDAWVPSTNNSTVFSGAAVTLADGHNIEIFRIGDDQIKLRPATTWDKRTGSITVAGGSLVGVMPEFGNDEVTLTWTRSGEDQRASFANQSVLVLTHFAADGVIRDRMKAVIENPTGTTSVPLSMTTAISLILTDDPISWATLVKLTGKNVFNVVRPIGVPL